MSRLLLPKKTTRAPIGGLDELAIAAKTNAAAKAKLFRECEPLIKSVAFECQRLNGADWNDVFQEASLGFLRAVELYRVGESSFLTYAKLWIHVKASRTGTIHHQGQRVRHPAQFHESLDAEVEGSGGLLLRDLVGGVEADQHAALERQHRNEVLMSLLRRLPPRERKLCEMRLEGATLREVGEAIGVSHEWVRKIEKQTLDKLRSFAA